MGRHVPVAALAFLGAALFGNCAMPHAHVDPSVDSLVDSAAGGGGAAGSGGTGGTPDSGPPVKGFLSLDQAARLCSFMFACPKLVSSVSYSLLLPIDTTSYSDCLDQLSGPIPPNRPGLMQQKSLLECAAKAVTCQAAGACMTVEYIEASDPRCQVTDGGNGCSPDGDAVYKCSEGHVLHCENAFYYPGSICMQNSSGPSLEYWCATAQNCAPQVTCSGTFANYCGGTQTQTFDCGVKGWGCGLDVKGEVHCLVDGVNPLCKTVGVECTSDHVRFCDGTAYADIDCTALGGYCDDQPFPHCARTKDACKQSDTALNQCSGDSVSVCVAGQLQSVDCTSLSLKCVAGSATQSAHCG